MPGSKLTYTLGATLIISFALVFSGCLPMPDRNSIDAREVVKSMEIAFAKTMADRDLEAFKQFISPESVFFNGNEPLRGKDAIIQAWSPFFKEKAAPFSWYPDVIEVLESGQLALSSGPVLNGSNEEIGRFNSIWRLDADGQWRVVFDKGS